MTGGFRIIFAPVLPLSLIEALALAAFLITLYGISRRARGSVLRGLVFALFALALANPSLIEEQREPLRDTALIVADESASMRLGDRMQQMATVIEALRHKLEASPDLDIETLSVKGTSETDLFAALDGKLSSIPHDRLAGIIAVTDGQVHDRPQSAGALPAPLHVLIAGHHDEIDRRLIIKEAPSYGVVGKTITLILRIEDEPKIADPAATVIFRSENDEDRTLKMPVGQDVRFDVPVTHAGPNLFAFTAAPLAGELTEINNSAAVTVNGIRDRLRVLLVSGEPHIGGRTWRNFLKSDPAVDLIHFTILRAPNKMDFTPNNELSLIAFPVHELFDVKLSSFDLVIFDRFRRQSLIPDEYLDNIANYVEQGGALLISNATDDEIPQFTLSPLARILPAEPTGHLLSGSFVPDVTDAGLRHPVTASLTTDMPRKDWGPWFRQTEARARSGEVLLSGINNAPLLVLSHVGKGRVAQFLSDQFWLWARGFHGGGPQADMLKRTAHWLVAEPELDESALHAHAEPTDTGWQILVSKRSLHDDNAVVSVNGPAAMNASVTLKAGSHPGLLEGILPVKDTGLYRLSEGSEKDHHTILIMVGPANAPEFGAMRSTEEKLDKIVKASGGGIFWLQDKPEGPSIRRTGSSGVQSGWDWIGLRRNEQYRVTGSKAYPLWPAWLAAVILVGASMLAWRREGR